MEILEDAGLLGAIPCLSPMEPKLKLTNFEGDLLNNPSTYRRIVGRLLYLTITRTDILYSVNILSQFITTPRLPHLDAAMQVLRYLKSSPGQGIFFPPNNPLQGDPSLDIAPSLETLPFPGVPRNNKQCHVPLLK